MGQIIIELPGNINRRCLPEDGGSVEVILSELEQSAKRIKVNSAAPTEDLADLRAAGCTRRESGFITLKKMKSALNL